jgi:Interferon-induced transmembrane protein
MFCGNCGSKSIEGDHFCITCGREQSPTPAAQSLPAPHLERQPAEMTSAVKVATSAPPVDRTVSPTITLVKPAERLVYCTHSPAQRSDLGGYALQGSEVCMGCRLPYAPGSPGSGLHGTVNPTVTLTQPAERPAYCRHSTSQRSTLGGYGQDGSEICMGCRLPYAPGSPDSGLRGPEANPTRMSSAPPNHLTWAILSLLFGCWPLGIPAIVYASRVNEKWIAGDITGAQSASRSAKDFAAWATILPIVLCFFIIVVVVAGSPS